MPLYPAARSAFGIDRPSLRPAARKTMSGPLPPFEARICCTYGE